MRRVLRAILILSGVLVLGVVALVAMVIFRQGVGRPVRYELRPGYRGWVVVRYEDPACPPTRTQGIYLVIAVSASGRGCTPRSSSKGWVYYRAEYVRPDGTRAKAPLQPISYREETHEEVLFAGTEAELLNSGPEPW